MDERLKQQQRRQRLERTRRVGKAGLWQTAKDQTGLGEALSGDGSDPERAYPELNNCPPHSRCFSDELGGQIFC